MQFFWQAHLMRLELIFWTVVHGLSQLESRDGWMGWDVSYIATVPTSVLPTLINPAPSVLST